MYKPKYLFIGLLLNAFIAQSVIASQAQSVMQMRQEMYRVNTDYKRCILRAKASRNYNVINNCIITMNKQRAYLMKRGLPNQSKIQNNHK